MLDVWGQFHVQNHFERDAVATGTPKAIFSSIQFFPSLDVTDWMRDGCLTQSAQSFTQILSLRNFSVSAIALRKVMVQRGAKRSLCHCKDKCKLKIRGLIHPVENIGRNFSFFF